MNPRYDQAAYKRVERLVWAALGRCQECGRPSQPYKRCADCRVKNVMRVERCQFKKRQWA